MVRPGAELTLNLMTLAEANRQPHATPKAAMVTRLDEKDAKDKDDEKQLNAWRKALRERAKGRCQKCGVKTIRTLELNTKRGEGHHIVGRANKALRYDSRNGLHLCLRCHSLFKAGKLFVQQIVTHMFKANGATHIDGSKPLIWLDKAS